MFGKYTCRKKRMAKTITLQRSAMVCETQSHVTNSEVRIDDELNGDYVTVTNQ